MATAREKELAIKLLTERVERLTGKKVTFKEAVKAPKDLPKAGKVAEQIRKIMGISQEELAKIAGVSVSTVGRGEKDFEKREKENQMKIITALYKKAGYKMPELDEDEE